MKPIQTKHIHWTIKTILVLICAVLLLGGIGYARGQKGEWKLPSHYPDGFDGYGCLMKISNTTVVIDDSQKALSPEWTYHTPEGDNRPIEYLKTNTLVGYMLNKSGEIVSIWLVMETCDKYYSKGSPN